MLFSSYGERREPLIELTDEELGPYLRKDFEKRYTAARKESERQRRLAELKQAPKLDIHIDL